MLFTLQSGYHTFRETLGIWEQRRHFQESIDPIACKDRIVWSVKYVEVGNVFSGKLVKYTYKWNRSIRWYNVRENNIKNY